MFREQVECAVRAQNQDASGSSKKTPRQKALPIRQKGRSVMQINTTRILPSADLKKSADGSSVSFAATMGVKYFLHFQCQETEA